MFGGGWKGVVGGWGQALSMPPPFKKGITAKPQGGGAGWEGYLLPEEVQLTHCENKLSYKVVL